MRNNRTLIRIFLRDLANRYFWGRPSHLTLFVTSACNYRCRMCFYWRQIEKQKKKMLTLPEFEKIAENFPSFTSIALTGGEPFLREDLPEIAKLFYEKCGARSIFVPTNASLPEKIFSQTAKILSGCPQALVTVCLSLDGIGKKHDQIRGKPGAFKKLVATCEKLQTLEKKYPNLELNCSFTFSHDNQDDFLATYRFATEKLGIKNFSVSLARGETRLREAKIIDIQKYLAATAEIDRLSFKQHQASKFGSFFAGILFARLALTKKLVAEIYETKKRPLPCLAGRFNLVIDEAGDVYPCEILDQKLGSLRANSYDIKNILGHFEPGDCACTHEFNLPDNILYTLPGLRKLFVQWVKLKF